MNPRRAAREFCFQYLFHLQLPIFQDVKNDLVHLKKRDDLIESIQEFKTSTNTLLSDELSHFALEMIEGALKHGQESDLIITKYLKNWTIKRLTRVDHTNLMLATYEICFDGKTPVNIVINEAIEIAKKFGNEDSPAFINATLDNIAKNEIKSGNKTS